MSDNDFQDDIEATSLKTIMSNSTYDKLKWLAQIGLPAVGALYFALSQIWGLPAGEEVVGTITVVDVFLGAILGLSARQYQNAIEGPAVGFVDVSYTESGKNFMLNFPGDPNDIDKHDKITFKVRRRE